ncbi:MAG: fliC [Blastococcus sp.]|nr:fliC [Blastococcus sp.]
MGMSVNTNVAALNAYRNLSVTDSQMNKSLERLSSGFRINRAADDAAGLAISEGLRSQIGGLKVAVSNTQDGVSVVQTAEGALTETHSILQRMRDLAVQSANDTNDTNSRAAIDAEADALNAELTRISSKTTFNNVNLLDGTYTNKQFQVGYAASDTINVSIAGGGKAAYNTFTDSIPATAGTWTFTQVADATGPVTSAAISVTTGSIAAGTSVDQIVSALNADTAFKTAFTASIDSTTGNLKVTATSGNGSAVGFTAGTVTGVTAGTGVAEAASGGGFSASDLGVIGIDLTSQSGATTAIGLINTAIQTVSTSRANLGALQNRFEHTINNLNVTAENLTASESRIRDTDMAQEMTNFSRTQILTQAGTSMLAQANQSSQSILKLLG